MSIFPLRKDPPIELPGRSLRQMAHDMPEPSEAQRRLKELVVASDGLVAAELHEVELELEDFKQLLAEGQADLLRAIDYRGEANSLTRRWLKTLRDALAKAQRAYRVAPVVQTEAPAETIVHPQHEAME